MELSPRLLEQAKSMLPQEWTVLQAELPFAQAFYLARHDDKTVHAFGPIEYLGVWYKIGVKTP